jgi:hypothetical protein
MASDPVRLIGEPVADFDMDRTFIGVDHDLITIAAGYSTPHKTYARLTRIQARKLIDLLLAAIYAAECYRPEEASDGE